MFTTYVILFFLFSLVFWCVGTVALLFITLLWKGIR